MPDGGTQREADQGLIRRIARGDPVALGELAARYEAGLFGLARGLLDGREDLARDALQDSWVRVLRHAGGFGGRSAVRTWLYRIVVNRCADVRTRALAMENGVAANGALGELAAPSAGDDPRSSGEELRQRVASLPDSARVILLLCYHRGLTHEQAAEVLGLPVGTLKSRLHAALSELRGRLGKDGGR